MLIGVNKFMKNQCENTKIAIKEISSMNCSADEHGGNAERFTPEQRADAIIQVVYADTPPPLWFELRDSIAAEIREAVELEREACANIADDAHKDEEYGHAAFRCVQISQAIRSRTE